MDKHAELLAQGYRQYTGKEVDVYFNGAICQHSERCIKGNAQLFDKGRRPWIMPDTVSGQEAMRVIDSCPSGALQYIKH